MSGENDENTIAADIPNSSSEFSINAPKNIAGPFQNIQLGAFVNSPSQMGMSGQTSGWGLSTIGRNMGGLMSYIQLLVTGSSKASRAAAFNSEFNGLRTHQPLGNSYFFNTGFECTDSTGTLRPAVGFINNVPLGNIPFISNVLGAGNVQELRGLLPSIFEGINGFNPLIITSALSINSGDPCNRFVELDPRFQLPMSHITSDGRDYIDPDRPFRYQQAYMFDSMVEQIDPCLFRGEIQNRKQVGRRNPVSGNNCREAFTNIDDQNKDSIHRKNIFNNIENELDNHLKNLNNLNKEDWIIQLYYISFSILIIFILIKVFNKHNKGI